MNEISNIISIVFCNKKGSKTFVWKRFKEFIQQNVERKCGSEEDISDWWSGFRFVIAVHYFEEISIFLLYSEKSGSKTFVSKRFLPRGETEKDGVTVRNVNSTYHWTHLEGTEFSLGVVVPVSQAKDELNTLQIPKGNSHNKRNNFLSISKSHSIETLVLLNIIFSFH